MSNITRISHGLLLLGLAASLSFAQTPAKLTQADCRSFFPRTNSSEPIRTLASGVQWTEVWEHGSWGPAEEFLGYIFVKSQSYEGGKIDVLVGLTKTGVISNVQVKGMNDSNDEFLAQFRGKTLQSNFEVVQSAGDLLFLPAKIKAMQGNAALSASIAQGVKDIALAANTVIK